MSVCRRVLCAAIFAALSASPVFAAPGSEKYEPMKRFTKVYDLIRSNYVEQVTDEEVMNGALKGMLQELDPHSTFLTADEFKEMQETTSGRFFGVGIEITTRNGQLMVVSPIEDTPAYKAGLKAGDIIISVDGVATMDMSMQEAVSKIRGAKGTAVELVIMHKDGKKPEPVKIVRDVIPMHSVKTSFISEEGILWVRLTRFSDNTTSELKDALKTQAAKAEIKGIVLDLRNNPGGLLNQSVSVSDVFLSEGNVVSIRGRGDKVLESYDSKNASDDMRCPLVVLVNSGSASASEIVAGALQDNNRAAVVGERSFGKGSVQNVIPLGDGTAVKMTIALYYTPKNRSIQAEGIQPDFEVPFEAPKDGDDPLNGLRIREKDYARHLEQGGKPKEEDKAGTEKKGEIPTDLPKVEEPAGPAKLVETDTKEMLAKDNQLRMALQLVIGLPKLSKVTR